MAGLRELAGGRADLLAEVAGILEGAVHRGRPGDLRAVPRRSKHPKTPRKEPGRRC